MPRPSSSSRTVLALVWSLTLCVAFVGGIVFEHFGREAQAQSAGVSTVFVPAGGLMFRTLDGRPIARISETSKGGSIELFDDHRDVGLRMQATHPTPTLLRENPYTVEERDPWTTNAAEHP